MKGASLHELGIMTSVLDAVKASAREAGATSVLKVSMSVGEMTEAIGDALFFAFEALTESDPLMQGAKLSIVTVKPKSHCLECGAEYEHDRFHMLCPECGSFATELLAGRELQIDSIEVDIPEDDAAGSDAVDGGVAACDVAESGDAADVAIEGDAAEGVAVAIEEVAAAVDEAAATVEGVVAENDVAEEPLVDVMPKNSEEQLCK